MDDLKVLIVDDGEDMLELLTDFLKEEFPNFQIEVAMNGYEALTELKKNRYDVVISDYDMPIMTGLELVHSLRTLPKKQRPTGVIILSAYIEPGEPDEEFKFVTFIMKEDYQENLINYFVNKLYLKNSIQDEEILESHNTTESLTTEAQKGIRIDLLIDNMTIMGVMKNLSIDGVSVLIAGDLPNIAFGKIIDVILDLKSFGNFKLQAKVIQRKNDYQGSILGLFFMGLTTEKKNLIQKYLES